eukprot:CAMPEP_0178911822 /NCGR_PEP_ID=MMETSP0786-20121207/9913_1 /TAXON_ID=186022 /ORGANISM="Thalassionema frauenfeldii, Strain CCMP 1798" /LENGTH=137 /DNA_ID=CAMNT_0020584321 /DNA_START=1505 /DNA_END=1918 /DNA_ORIENTATION=+
MALDQARFGKASRKLCVCEICLSFRNVAIVNCKENTHFPWMIALKCTQNPSHKMWYICGKCPPDSVRCRMTSCPQLQRHHRKCHKNDEEDCSSVLVEDWPQAMEDDAEVLPPISLSTIICGPEEEEGTVMLPAASWW